MIAFSHAKINLGLFVMNKRPDGFHALESVFWPVDWTDVLEVHAKPSPGLELKITGLEVPGNLESNLIAKAYELMAREFNIGGVTAHLHKIIPMGAGLGGGSSNATCMIRLLDQLFSLNLTDEAALQLAAQLGSDCPFFWKSAAALVTGRGEHLAPVPGIQSESWNNMHLTVIHPGVHVSTSEAFAGCEPKMRTLDWTKLSDHPPKSWSQWLQNDFEAGVRALHLPIHSALELLQNSGADYVQMTGTGSAAFGVFARESEATAAARAAIEQGWASRSFAMNACL